MLNQLSLKANTEYANNGIEIIFETLQFLSSVRVETANFVTANEPLWHVLYEFISCVLLHLLCLSRWDIFGAVIGTECGTLESGSAMVFLRDGERKICTPYMDTTGYGNLRFYFSMGEYKLLM